MWVERGMLGLGPIFFTLGQFFALYLNYLYFGQIVFCGGLAWVSGFIGLVSIGTTGVIISEYLLPRRKQLIEQIDKPF